MIDFYRTGLELKCLALKKKTQLSYIYIYVCGDLCFNLRITACHNRKKAMFSLEDLEDTGPQWCHCW